ncbi:hypothetical protein IFR05_003451 [Cadophora sp. M221]|nr:hypothetical protein IFR05_003451 [Cadophora sp. M221]
MVYKINIMANKKKESAPMAQTQTLPPPNEIPQEMTDDDSDAGTFLDDDMEDFLPSGWVGGEKKNVVYDYKSRKKGSVKSKPAAMKVPPSTTATANGPAPKQGPTQLLAARDLDVNLSSLSITKEESKTTMQSATFTTSNSPNVTAVAVESKPNTDLANANLRINMVGIEKHGLDMTIAHLNRAAANHRASEERLGQALRQKRTQHSTLHEKNNELKLKKTTLREKSARTNSDHLAASFRESIEVQRAIANLRTLRITHDKLKCDFSELTCNFEIVKLDRDAKENDYRTALKYRNIVQHVLDTTTDLMGMKDQLIQSLKDENTESKTTRGLLSPLVQIGVDIRLRNLEFARETALDVPTSDLDRATTLSGNIAAHRANGTVDAVLFEAGLLPEGCIEEATRVFKILYPVEPSRYKTEWGSRIKRVIDYRATVKTVKSVAGSNNCSHLESEHYSLDDKLSKLHDDMLDKDSFESDPTVEAQLSRLEEITEEIVDIKRSKGGRRRRRSPFIDSIEESSVWSPSLATDDWFFS